MSALDDLLHEDEWCASGLRGEMVDTMKCWPTEDIAAARAELAALRQRVKAAEALAENPWLVLLDRHPPGVYQVEIGYGIEGDPDSPRAAIITRPDGLPMHRPPATEAT